MKASVMTTVSRGTATRGAFPGGGEDVQDEARKVEAMLVVQQCERRSAERGEEGGSEAEGCQLT